MKRKLHFAAGAILACSSALAQTPATDPANPTCPKQLNWSTYRTMRFTLDQANGARVLKAEGLVDDGVAARLQEALS
ncbi:MAG: hypothetical protein M3428_06305, partial [Pseudomonadota bacterium]|nr:hypothetical protein [Pseudomonadota bacterium]